MDNINMKKQYNKIKLINYSMLNIPQNAILSYADGETVVLDKITTTRFYDSGDKSYRSYSSFYKINGHYYA